MLVSQGCVFPQEVFDVFEKETLGISVKEGSDSINKKTVLAGVRCLLSWTVRLQCWQSPSLHEVYFIYIIQSAVKAEVFELLSFFENTSD